MKRRRETFMEHMEGLFDSYGCSNLYEQMKDRFIQAGIWQQVDIELVEHFFESFDFHDDETITAEEFIYFWKIFTVIQKSNVGIANYY
jgi:hypothetical protein